jgi:hypothetical protein
MILIINIIMILIKHILDDFNHDFNQMHLKIHLWMELQGGLTLSQL